VHISTLVGFQERFRRKKELEMRFNFVQPVTQNQFDHFLIFFEKQGKRRNISLIEHKRLG
jgi:hypothetical protein